MNELFEIIKAILLKHPHTGSSTVLAKAMASACSSSYGVSMLDCSVNLDNENREIIWKLANIRSLDGYSNAIQDETLGWLKDQGYIK